MPNRILVTLAAMATLTAPLPAAAFVTDNDFRTYPAGPDSVIVRPMGGGSARDYFCAAGDWARRVKGAPYGAYLVMTRSIARDPDFRGAFTAEFTLAAPGSGDGAPGLFVANRAGTSMSVAHARNVCFAHILLPGN